MNLISKIFNSGNSIIICPRCLGKGNVNWDDIKRLKKELKWIPGSCAYCNGKGKVNSQMEKSVAVDSTYLVNSLSKEERTRFIKNDPDALERAQKYDSQVDDFLDQIRYLHFEGKLNINQIAEFYLISKSSYDSYEKEKTTLINYIDRVIQIKKEK